MELRQARAALTYVRLHLVRGLSHLPDPALDAVRVPWDTGVPPGTTMVSLGVYLATIGPRGLLLDREADLGRFLLTQKANPGWLGRFRQQMTGQLQPDVAERHIPSSELFTVIEAPVLARGLVQAMKRCGPYLTEESRSAMLRAIELIRLVPSSAILPSEEGNGSSAPM
jgi:hypothetical protein